MAFNVAPGLRLTYSALQKHTKAQATTLRIGSEKENSVSSTDYELLAEQLGTNGQLDDISLDPETRRQMLAQSQALYLAFNGVPIQGKSAILPSPVDDRPVWARTVGKGVYAGTSEGEAIHQITPGLLDSPSNASDKEAGIAAVRLVNTSSAEGEHCLNVLTSHLPQFRHVRTYGELGSYLDQSQYAICMGSEPLDDLRYGIVIVPIGEEEMLSRPEHNFRDTPPSTRPDAVII